MELCIELSASCHAGFPDVGSQHSLLSRVFGRFRLGLARKDGSNLARLTSMKLQQVLEATAD